MSNVATFYKLLNLKETEKNMAQKDYQESVDHFEEKATKLYHLLKQKEDAELKYLETLELPTNVSTLHLNQQYIERLEKQINQLQPSVQQARGEMEEKQEKLSSAHIEMKKYEKIIERKEESYKASVATQEKKDMDEISMQQFISQGS